LKKWTRTTALGSDGSGTVEETWRCFDDDRVVASFDVEVTVGKRLDVVGLKGTSLEDIHSYAKFLSASAAKLYDLEQPMRRIASCPCCDADTGEAPDFMGVFGVTYKRCLACGHCFVPVQPSLDALTEYYEESSVTYTDREAIEIRLAHVVGPKLDWVSRIFEQRYGRRALSALDVGAAGAHFLEVCRRAGMRIGGYEISGRSRQFAKNMFDVDLKADDFVDAECDGEAYDLITFWGLLEYTPNPKRFLSAARKWFGARDGILVVEVPRVDCVGTVIQKETPEGVARHMDPTNHMNCFSDASLATALLTTGFKPVAAWYFGMDAYELLIQLGLKVKDPKFVDRVAHLIPPLQASFDSGRLCDDIVIAAVPIDGPDVL